MKIFGKTISKKVKRELILRLILIIIAGTILLFFSFYSFGWFSVRVRSNVTSMRIAVSTGNYDVLIERTTTYDSGYSHITGEDGLKNKLASSEGGSYSLSETSTVNASDIAYELVNEYESEYQGQMRRYLMPGSYGTVTFYLRPKTAADFTATFDLTVAGYVLNYNEDTDSDELDAIVSVPVLNMLKGHFLFFTGRTGADYEDYEYTGLIDGSFTYNTALHTKCADPGKTDCYKIVLYWEWPITYYEITDNLSTSDPAVTKKYPTAVSTYLTEHPGYFFPSTPRTATIDAYSDAYNDGDQLIGDGADCIVLYISAH